MTTDTPLLARVMTYISCPACGAMMANQGGLGSTAVCRARNCANRDKVFNVVVPTIELRERRG
jgi:hypothetical protein